MLSYNNIFSQRNFLKIIIYISFLLLLLGHNLFDRKALLILFLSLCIFNIKNISGFIYRVKGNYPLLLVISWCLISSSWSDWRYKSIEESIVQLVMVLSCILITCTYNIRTILYLLKKAAISVIIINLIYISLNPSVIFSPSGLSGIYGHKNNFGFVIAICLISILFNTKNFKSRLDIIVITIGFVLLSLSLSKTSIFIFLFSVCTSILVNNLNLEFFKKHINIINIISFLSTLFVMFLLITYRMEILKYIILTINDDFMTGRGGLWINMLIHSEENLITGFGFNSVWGKDDMSEIYFTSLFDTNPIWVNNLSASDGGYIDLILSIGIIGFSFFLFFIKNTLIKLISKNKSIEFPCIFSLFIFIILHNVSETTFLLSTNVLWFLAILISSIAVNKNQHWNNHNV